MAIDLEKVTFTNFRSYKGGPHTHTFKPGVWYILAKNHDPGFDSNGGGKSSLLASVAWALYGVLATGSDKDEVIHHGTPETCVEVTFAGEFDLFVRRTKKRGDAERLEFFDSRRGWVRSDLLYVQAQLNEVLGLTRQTFFNSFWIDRESRTKQFLFAKPSERQKILEELIGEDVYGPAKTKTTSMRSNAEKERATKIAERDGLFEQMALTRQTLKQAKEDLAREEERKAQRDAEIANALQKVEGDIDKIKQELGTLAVRLEGLHRSLPIDLTSRDLEITAVAVSNEIRSLELDLAKDLADPNTICSCCGQVITPTHHKAQQAERNKKAAKIVTLRTTLQAYRKQVVEIKALEGEVLSAKQKDVRLKERLSDLVDLRQQTLDRLPTVEDHLPVLQQRITAMTDRLRQTFERYQGVKARVGELDALLPVYRLCEEAFGSRGIQNLRLDDVRHLMQQFTDQYLTSLAQGAIKIEYPYVTDGFRVLLTMNGEKADIASFSRGEAWRACLSVLLALRRVILFLNRSPLNFVVLDDAGSDLDDSGIDAIHALSEVLSKEIRHVLIAAPHDYACVPNHRVVRVEKKHGVSRIM